MVFSSLTFICAFFPIVLILYMLSKNITYRNAVLTVSSLVFYAWGEPVYIILMVLSILFNYYAGLEIEQTHKKSTLALQVKVLFCDRYVILRSERYTAPC